MKILKRLLLLLLIMGAAFGWMMLVLLILSFVALSYITIKLTAMYIVSGAFAALIGTVFFVKDRKRDRKSR